MAKYHGSVGYVSTEETSPGVWEETVIEKEYFGDVVRNAHRWQTAENLNDNFNISNQFSIVADPYAYNNLYNIRYLTFLGQKWKVTNVEVQYPRLILEVGGVYNGQQD